MLESVNILAYAFLLINVYASFANGEETCEEVKKKILADGHYLNCNKTDLVNEACASVSISKESGDVGAAASPAVLALGSYIPLGVREGVDTPIYYKAKGQDDKHGPFFLYRGQNSWFVTDNTFAYTDKYVMKSKHCKFDKKKFEGCSGKWNVEFQSKTPSLNIVCDETSGNGWHTAGIVVGVIAAVAIIIILVVVVMRKRARRSRNI